MECWEHPGVDATGVCVQCGKAGCRHCLTMAAGALFCRSCATRLDAKKADVAKRGPADPRKRMIAAWIGAGAFAVQGVVVVLTVPTDPSVPRPSAAALALPLLIYAWMGWSVVWTAPPIFGWLHRKAVRPLAASVRGAQPGCLLSGLYALLTVAIVWYLLSIPALAVALVYALFGGGIREARRCRREWAAEASRDSGSPGN